MAAISFIYASLSEANALSCLSRELFQVSKAIAATLAAKARYVVNTTILGRRFCTVISTLEKRIRLGL